MSYLYYSPLYGRVGGFGFFLYLDELEVVL